jgi:C1A family cysteine protease
MSKRYGTGWVRDLPDIRDYRPDHKEIRAALKGSRALKAKPPKASSSVDLSPYCSAIEDQGDLGSCTAQAGVGLLEYFENRAFDRYLDASRLFLYKVTRNLLNWTGDTGAQVRTTMQAMVLFGIPPEKYLPYDVKSFDDEPSPFCYSFARNYKSIKYYRHDGPNITGAAALASVKSHLQAGLPSMFGFTVYNFGNDKGEFTYPTPKESVQGGHAVVAIGYDDKRKIGAETGALKIRNSWGTSWGEDGYGWLPYRYVTDGLASDFWSLIKADYIETGNFE